ncbi:N-acetyltransferase family protein, partial [Pandoraea pneumonica]|uniref:GNAT family N-acetyltransferase n=2 Tax=Burkholderiaceae TaxID=119060 RepID=UPI003CEDD6A7
EKATALTPGLLVSQPHELQVDAFEQKIEFLEQEGMYLVAERQGVLIGHALLEPMVLIAQAHVFSLTIVVHPGYLEHGIGTALMVELMGWAENNPRV